MTAAAAVFVTLLVIHHQNTKSTVAGCVMAGSTEMSVTDEKDEQTYTLIGDPVGFKPGYRMPLAGRQRNRGNRERIFEGHSITKDFGVCQPVGN